MTQIINKELSRLQTPKTSTGYEHYANKLIKNKNIYPLQEEIIEILRKTISLKNDSQLAALPIEIIKHLIATNSSMALETISFAATQKNNENLTVWPEIRETFFDLLSDEINSDIFKSVDPTDTRFLFNFFDQYNMNQKNDRVSVEIISSFHKLAFEHGLKLEKPLIPMIIYHIEKSLIPPNYNFESAWDINLLKEIILSFESVDLTIYQHQDELQGYLEKWKNLAKNNQPPLYQ